MRLPPTQVLLLQREAQTIITRTDIPASHTPSCALMKGNDQMGKELLALTLWSQLAAEVAPTFLPIWRLGRVMHAATFPWSTWGTPPHLPL